MSKKIKRYYEFEPFRLDIRNRLLLRDGKIVPLKPKVFDTLLLLVENNGSVLSKDELLEKLWEDTVVEESNLTQNIYMLRKALGDGSNGIRYLETIPKRGYRFIAPVKEGFDAEADDELQSSSATAAAAAAADDNEKEREASTEVPIIKTPSPPAAITQKNQTGLNRRFLLVPILLLVALAAAAAALFFTLRSNKTGEPANTSGIKSIAVLPFNSLGPGSDADLMGAGMTDALITKLSNVKNFKVLPTGAVLKYSAEKSDPITYGRQLGVDSVLDGKIQRSGDSIRVTVQLARVRDGAMLWAKQFDENSNNLFAVQDSISEQVAQALTLRLSAEEQEQLRKHYTENAAAYEAYLKGRYFWNKRTIEGFNKGIEYFEQSINIDPHYGPAYAGLADCYMRLNDRGVPPLEGTVPRAKAAVMKALEIDDSLGEAHATLGFINFRFDWDFPGAEREFKKAVELNPNYSIVHQWYAFYLLTMNRQTEALAELSRARELDPLSLNISSGFGTYFYFTRQYEKAIAELQKTIEMERGFAEARWMLGLAYEQQGKSEEAEKEFESLRVSTDNSNIGISSSLAHLYAATGKTAQSRKLLGELQERSKEKYVSPYDVAIVYAGLGENDQALMWLERAYAERALRPAWLKFDPRLDALRPLSRFQDLLRRGGLTS